MGRSYIAKLDSVSVSAAQTLIEIAAGSADIIEILRAWIGQDASETSEQLKAEIHRKDATGTGTAHTPVKLVPGDPASGATVKTDLTGEGTVGDILLTESFNVLSGWLYVPVPEERIIVPPGGIIGLKLDTSPAAALTLTAGIIYREIG